MKLTLNEAYIKYADKVFAAAFSVCRNQADADDIVQDTFIKYHSNEQDYNDEEHIRAWLLRVAINRAKDISKSFWQKNKVSWEEYINDLSFEEPADSRLFEAVMKLPKKYRIVIHLFYYEDYSVKEIAAVLNRSEGTVKSQLCRGRKLLKDMLMEEWDNDEQ